MTTAKGTARVRYSFTAQFLCSSAMFACRCAEIESIDTDNLDETIRTEHRGLVTAAIMQCAAAIEAESAELLIHGPGHHLGSNGIDTKARDFLAPLAEFIGRLDALQRYKVILQILGKRPLLEGQEPCQSMRLLVKLRNELVHYKSRWGEEMDGDKLFKALRKLHLQKPPFISSSSNFFPHQLLSAECAAWSVRTAVAFLNAVYERLKIKSPLKPCMSQFEGL